MDHQLSPIESKKQQKSCSIVTKALNLKEKAPNLLKEELANQTVKRSLSPTNKQPVSSSLPVPTTAKTVPFDFKYLKQCPVEFPDLECDKMENKMYQCPQTGCLSSFDRPFKLAQHILAHNNIRPYVCNEPNCSKAYTTKCHLNRHKTSVHMGEDNDVIYSCPKCLNSFSNRQNLKRHLNTVHSTEFICEICKKRFKKKNQLTAHLYLHTGVKAFKCDLCSDTFASLYLKKRHMRYHKTYTCNKCNAVFNHWSKFQKHKKTDHEQNEYICNECKRVFKQRIHILRHVKIHAEKHKSKEFFCPYENCQRFYSRNSNLKQHILTKHMKMTHECKICKAQLSSKAKLKYHIQLHNRTEVGPSQQPKKTQKKKRKDECSFKSSTALKLSGLLEFPEELSSKPLDLSGQSECKEVEAADVHSSVA